MTRRARDVAGCSFVAQVNYVGALDRDSARVVSCNTSRIFRLNNDAIDRGAHRGVPGDAP